jgi:hypothetical protein
MPETVTKMAMANFRRARREKYKDDLLSSECPRKEIPSLTSGFDDGMRAMLSGLIEMGHLRWSEEPTPIKPVQS